jgi:hypothetical protein
MVAHGSHRDDNIIIADLAWKKRDRQTNLINEGRGDFKMVRFRIVRLPSGEKSKKNVVRVKVLHDLKPSKNPKGGAPPGPNTRPNVPDP